MSVSNLQLNRLKNSILTFFLVFIFNASVIKAQPIEVIAEKGDGIYSILSRNGLSGMKHLDKFIELNQNSIGKDKTLIPGKKYFLPDTNQNQLTASILKTESVRNNTGTKISEQQKSKGTIVKHEIFGKDYQDVEILGTQLKGAIYYLISGHGGPDPGAMAKYEGTFLCEDEYAYDVTLRLARNLIQNGATVYMITRDPNDGIRDESILMPDKDEFCFPDKEIPLNQLKRLKQRTDVVNNLYRQNRKAFQRVIAVHVDSRNKSKNIDVFFYHDARSETGKKAVRILQQTFQEKYNQNQPGRGYQGTVSTRNLYEVINTFPVAIYIELGNINHTRDLQRLIITNNRQALANWLCEGLITDFNKNK